MGNGSLISISSRNCNIETKFRRKKEKKLGTTVQYKIYASKDIGTQIMVKRRRRGIAEFYSSKLFDEISLNKVLKGTLFTICS